MKTTIGGIFLVVAASIPVIFMNKDIGARKPQIDSPVPVTLDSDYTPSGWMGDAEEGTKYLKFERKSMEYLGEKISAIKIEYSRGPKGWTGIYWLFPDGNWGKVPGKNLSGIRRIKFLAKGENGSEVVEFLSGGVSGTSGDSYGKISIGFKHLEIEWQEYEIDLAGYDLSNVVGPFAWSCAGSNVEGEAVIFYIANLRFER